MKVHHLEEDLKMNPYPGRGIVIGRSSDGKYAVTAYFIMGRSVNSRNRVFVTEGEGIRTQAFDPARLSDPSLIIYAPVRVLDQDIIVTNGDQTDTIFDGLQKGLTFEQSLRSRKFEPDEPNFTPRISGVLHLREPYSYEMSSLKAAEEIRTRVTALPTLMKTRFRAKDILSIRIRETALCFPVLKGNRNRS